MHGLFFVFPPFTKGDYIMKIFEREEMICEEGIEQGIAQGQSEGTMLHLLQQITKKITKGQSPDVIAEELDEDVASITKLYELIQKKHGKTAAELLPFINLSGILSHETSADKASYM